MGRVDILSVIANPFSEFPIGSGPSPTAGYVTSTAVSGKIKSLLCPSTTQWWSM